jgi:hypothetical protein
MPEILCARCGKIADPFERRPEGPVCEDCLEGGQQ